MKTGRKLPLALLVALYAVAYDHPILCMLGFGLAYLVIMVARKIILDPNVGGMD